MTMNVGTIDRVVRIVVGVVLIAYAIPLGFPSTGWNWVGWIGIVSLYRARPLVLSCERPPALSGRFVQYLTKVRRMG
jgi:hypothetical protein